MKTPLQWAFIIGAIGFALGFFGPMILDPSSGNGPLLGIFITGPGGFVVGLLYGFWRNRNGIHELDKSIRKSSR